MFPIQLPEKSGPIIIAFSALFFSLNTPLAPLFFDAGGNPVTLNLVRSGISAICGLVVLLAFKKRLDLTPYALKMSALIGLMIMAQGLCYLASVQYIPVGLAALIFYTWPIIVAIAAPLVGDKPASAKALLLFLLAFGGLVLAIGANLEALDWRGVGLAFVAGCLIAAMVLSTRKAVSNIAPLSLAVTCTFFSSFYMLLAIPFLGGWVFPFEGAALVVAAIISIFFFGAILFQNLGLKRTNAQTAAIIYNLEPILSILAAFFALGEVLIFQQYIGAGIVVVSLSLYQLTQK